MTVTLKGYDYTTIVHDYRTLKGPIVIHYTIMQRFNAKLSDAKSSNDMSKYELKYRKILRKRPCLFLHHISHNIIITNWIE